MPGPPWTRLKPLKAPLQLSFPGDLDVITLETCQSNVAMALGMVMAGTGERSKSSWNIRIFEVVKKKVRQKMEFNDLNS